MAYPKRLRPANYSNQDRAIEAHAGFVSYVVGKVKKEGLENVLMSSRADSSKLNKKKDLYWLKQALERVLNFAEEVQIKRIPTTLEGTGRDGEFVVRVEISDENKAPSEPGNRISEYFEV